MNRFVIGDPKDCIGCNTCMAACSEVHKAFGLQSYPRLQVMRNDDVTVPILCRHCDDSPCATVCPVHAITHDGDTIQLNEGLCIGCKLCAIACPFGAITQHGSAPLDAPNHYDTFSFTDAVKRDIRTAPNNTDVHNMLAWEPGVKAIAVKCDLCYFREEGPACVQTCPTKTLFLISEESIEQANRKKREMAMSSSPVIPR